MTTVRVLTPAGRGAIAVVEVTGDRAAALIDACFESVSGGSACEQPIDAIRYGVWRHDPTHAGEELVVARTANDRYEVQCHGGLAAPSAIVAALRQRGAVGAPLATPKSLSADALALLTRAPTERVAALLLDQANGALERAVAQIVAAINDEDITAAGAAIDELLRYRRLAERLAEPWRVVIAGPPNVGKSSLVNALVGYPRAIVFDQPGTTRDAVAATTAIGGWPVRLTDTAGIRDANDPIERAGVDLAKRVLREADIVLRVREAVDHIDAQRDEQHTELAENALVIDIASKADLAQSADVLPDNVIATSATQRIGIDRVLAAIEERIAPPLPAGQATPFRGWHVERLDEAQGALVRGDLAAAAAAMAALLSHNGL